MCRLTVYATVALHAQLLYVQYFQIRPLSPGCNNYIDSIVIQAEIGDPVLSQKTL